MEKRIDNYYEKKLVEKQQRLKSAIATLGKEEYLRTLLDEVDAALERVATGSYGICEECHEEIEEDRLLANPLLRFCLDHLSTDEQHALEEDIKLASQIQGALLPPRKRQLYGWDISYYYQPAGAVSGDFCDLVKNED